MIDPRGKTVDPPRVPPPRIDPPVCLLTVVNP